jgi:hypothetical protein
LGIWGLSQEFSEFGDCPQFPKSPSFTGPDIAFVILKG